eukprot:CAMPEP_0168574896 /NCGR_PEP_ID=MMETSP0413-20121227/19350_1 /TAXON_ID=136452 /ORGANISM="Filamoeba nolandi, Strain NC-AS-23-1" /LENGTH=918 /DNA_ID=CAMNT_0008608319 /DNA_START=71 /DNA_END=2824 /DNA_ORIENTATION=+
MSSASDNADVKKEKKLKKESTKEKKEKKEKRKTQTVQESASSSKTEDTASESVTEQPKARKESNATQESQPSEHKESKNEKEDTEDEEENSATEAPKPLEDDEDAEDADDLLLEQRDDLEESLRKKKETIKLKESKTKRALNKLKSVKQFFDDEEDEDNAWIQERECLLLVLHARLLLKEMIELRLKEDRIASGQLSVDEIQNLLKSQKEDQETDWVAKIQELKRNLVSEVRRNHVLEREVTKLDKRIALLIKNRGNIQEILAHSSSKKSKKGEDGNKTDLLADPKKLELYQNLFYLLQTETKYIANLVYMMNTEQMDSFLDTVILTLFGDAFSPREEFLILKLFANAIQREMQSVKDVSSFLKADSVVPRMVVAYNRRKQGSEFLRSVIGPVLKDIIAKDVNLETKPNIIYQTMISQQEIESGQRSTMDRALNEDQIMDLKEIKAIVQTRLDSIKDICQSIFDVTTKNLKKLPYGIKWICKQIRTIAQEKFKSSSEDDILKVTGYFVYYRFINLAIVTPENFGIVDKDPSPTARKNLVVISKVLQKLFNLSLFDNSDKWMMPLNDWMKSNFDTVRDFFTDLVEVPEPEEFLDVDKYMELTQKSKPVIIISLREIAGTHALLSQHIEKLAKEKDDPLRIIVKDLGEAPAMPREDDDREVQLTLTNRFKQNTEDEISASAALYAETKELIINVFRSIPVADSPDEGLSNILNNGKAYAKEKSNSALVNQIDKVLENIKTLEGEGLISKNDNHAAFLKDIALEVANRQQIREQQRKEVKRLSQTLKNLTKHQKYLNEQIQQYNDYLQDARLKHYQQKSKKSKKKGEEGTKIGPFKFSYGALAKKGVIVDSEVPAAMRKKTTFYISSEAVGVFDITAFILGKEVEKMTLELDDLLERNSNNITRLELDQVTLDVNMTIHLI